MNRYLPFLRFLFPCVLLLTAMSCSKKSADHKSIPGFEIEDGFKIELIASEPLVTDPVDMEIDEYGRLYVVEMPGYPLDKTGSGKIKLLTDENKDGQLDKSFLFADNLVLPNSVMRWKKGILVTDAPYVLYFEDINGDNQADVRDTLLTGFALSNPQHNLNSPMLGINNWIYLAHEGAVQTETFKNEFGDTGSDIFYPHQPSAQRLPTNAGGRSVRFQPDKGLLEMNASRTQFGHTFDVWGHYLLVDNSNHVFQEMIPERYLRRNPELLITNVTQSLSDHGNAAEVFPITTDPLNQLLTDVGVITSACGITAYTGGLFPTPYDGTITFVAEPVSNIIHVDRLEENGSTFSAKRIHQTKEFLASADARFRPVNMYIGPDGALYVVDYYRQIIEHPEWMSEDVVKSGELYNDADKGRIYRISPVNAPDVTWTKGLRLEDATTEELAGYLADENSWWRMNAQRLLLDKQDKKVIPILRAMTADEKLPFGRLHSLWTLEGMDALTPDLIERALKDPVAGIRENAIVLAEKHLSGGPQLQSMLVTMGNDPDAKVRFQLLCTLGSLLTEEAARARELLIFTDLSDKWVQAAALTTDPSQTSALLASMIDRFLPDISASGSLVQQLTAQVAAGNPSFAHELFSRTVRMKSAYHPTLQTAIIEGLARGIKDAKQGFRLTKEEGKNLFIVIFDHPTPTIRKASLKILKASIVDDQLMLKEAVAKAVHIAGDPAETEERRTESIDMISLYNPARNLTLLKKLIVPSEALPIQLAVLRTFQAIQDTTVTGFLINRWTTLTPELQDAAISTMLSNVNNMDLLLTAVESGEIQVSAFSWPRRVRLMAQSNPELKSRARAIFTRNNDAEVNLSYQEALKKKGDAVKGLDIYQKQCALCHQIRGKEGINFGPDLGTIHNWSKDAIMANILSPGLSISSGFDLWTVELNNGENFQGVIASETPVALTFRNSGTMDRIVKRGDIKSLKALNMSAMPVGLDQQISVVEMADLLAYLKKNK